MDKLDLMIRKGSCIRGRFSLDSVLQHRCVGRNCQNKDRDILKMIVKEAMAHRSYKGRSLKAVEQSAMSSTCGLRW
eukprot:693923-Amphidinium_carterae.1